MSSKIKKVSKILCFQKKKGLYQNSAASFSGDFHGRSFLKVLSTFLNTSEHQVVLYFSNDKTTQVALLYLKNILVKVEVAEKKYSKSTRYQKKLLR